VNNGSDMLHSLAGFDPHSVRSVYKSSTALCHDCHLTQRSHNRHKLLSLKHKSVCTSQSTDVDEDKLTERGFLQRLPPL
jgi:hypothetical protein